LTPRPGRRRRGDLLGEGGRRREGLRLGAEDQQRRVLEGDADTERGQQEGDVRGAANGAVGDPLHQDADEDGGDDRQRRGDREGPAGEDEEDGGVAAEHQHLAVGEVDQPEDAEDHRQPDRDQGVDRAKAEGVDQLLGELGSAHGQATSAASLEAGGIAANER
jgi:hypothetical protein